MRRHWKEALWLLLAVVLVLTLLSPAYAATRREKIANVKLKVECDKTPEAGDDIGTVKVTVSDDRIEVSEPAEFYDTEDDTWVRGEVPVIRLELSVKDEEKHYFTSSTKVRVSGHHSELKSKKVTHGGDSLQIEIKLEKVSGDLAEVEDYYWEGNVAEWSEVDGASKYEIKLYRGNSQVTTVTTNQEKYDFFPYMNKAGDYTFKVRAISSSDNEKGKWTDKSEECSIDEKDVYKGNPPENGNLNSGPSVNPPYPGSYGNPGQQRYGWNQDSAGWTYRMNDGSLARNRWLFVDNNWFYLSENGYMKTDWIYVDNNWFYLNPISDGTRGAMKTGWQDINGARYYLNPISDGTRGAMKTGWQNIDGARYYFNPISDGTRGSMKTGYQQIDGRWYYFDTANGQLWFNRNTPNGRWADGNGMIQ